MSNVVLLPLQLAISRKFQVPITPMHMRHGQIQLSLLPSFRFDRRWRVRKLPTFNQCYLLYFYVNSPRPDA